MIKAILIDLDNTLYDYNICQRNAEDSVFKFIEPIFNKDDFISAYEKAKNYIHSELKNTASSHNRLLYFQKTLEYLNSHDILLAKILYKIYWNHFLESIKLFDGVIEFFEKNKDKKICIVTDLTAFIQYRKIEKMGIAKYISYIVTSEEAGVEKPNEKIFNTALQKLKLKSNEVCMIGDNYEKDIIGALKLNIKAFWKTNNISNINKVVSFNNFQEIMGKINE